MRAMLIRSEAPRATGCMRVVCPAWIVPHNAPGSPRCEFMGGGQRRWRALMQSTARRYLMLRLHSP